MRNLRNNFFMTLRTMLLAVDMPGVLRAPNGSSQVYGRVSTVTQERYVRLAFASNTHSRGGTRATTEHKTRNFFFLSSATRRSCVSFFSAKINCLHRNQPNAPILALFVNEIRDNSEWKTYFCQGTSRRRLICALQAWFDGRAAVLARNERF